MLQTLAPPTTTEVVPDATVPLIVIRDGQPVYVQIDYALYLQLQEAIDEWYAEQRVIAEADRNSAAIAKDPSTLASQADLKSRLAKLLQSEAYQTMLASQSTLRKEWDQPEEDEAWANL